MLSFQHPRPKKRKTRTFRSLKQGSRKKTFSEKNEGNNNYTQNLLQTTTHAMMITYLIKCAVLERKVKFPWKYYLWKPPSLYDNTITCDETQSKILQQYCHAWVCFIYLVEKKYNVVVEI
jgi:hypothetical protein